MYNAQVHAYQQQQAQLQQRAQQQAQQQAVYATAASRNSGLSRAVHATAANADAARLWAGAALGQNYKKLADSANIVVPPPQRSGFPLFFCDFQ